MTPKYKHSDKLKVLTCQHLNGTITVKYIYLSSFGYFKYSQDGDHYFEDHELELIPETNECKKQVDLIVYQHSQGICSVVIKNSAEHVRLHLDNWVKHVGNFKADI